MMPQDTEVDIIQINPSSHYLLRISGPDMQSIQANKTRVERRLNDWLASGDRFLTLAVTSDTILQLERVDIPDEEELLPEPAPPEEPATVKVDPFGHPIA